MKVAIIGKGNVGKALARGLERAGHEVRHGHRDPAEPVDKACAWGDAVILAVPFGQVGDAVRQAGEHVANKPLVDVTNALDDNYELVLGPATSGAEELQRFAPQAKVVKAFNTVFADTMANGRVQGQPLAAFVAGDDPEAKRVALQLAKDIGFQAVDAGPLKAARYLEPLGRLNIALGYDQGMGQQMGLTLLGAQPRKEAPAEAR